MSMLPWSPHHVNVTVVTTPCQCYRGHHTMSMLPWSPHHVNVTVFYITTISISYNAYCHCICNIYATFIFLEFCSQNGRRRPFWMTEHHFRSIRNFFVLEIFHKMAGGGYLGWAKITMTMTMNLFTTYIIYIHIIRQLWLTSYICGEGSNLEGQCSYCCLLTGPM